jgi:hypothetical protein
MTPIIAGSDAAAKPDTSLGEDASSGEEIVALPEGCGCRQVNAPAGASSLLLFAAFSGLLAIFRRRVPRRR